MINGKSLLPDAKRKFIDYAGNFIGASWINIGFFAL